MFRCILFSTDSDMELVTGQGIDSIKEINTLTQDCVTSICSIIRKPGGRTDGHVVFYPAENIFDLLLYYCQHQDGVTWDTDRSLVTLVNICALFE